MAVSLQYMDKNCALLDPNHIGHDLYAEAVLQGQHADDYNEAGEKVTGRPQYLYLVVCERSSLVKAGVTGMSEYDLCERYTSNHGQIEQHAYIEITNGKCVFMCQIVRNCSYNLFCAFYFAGITRTIVERLFLSMCKFNQWRNEFVNLRCTVHTDGATSEPLTVDMRVIYVMHAFFLANAPLNVISKFADVRSNHINTTRWSVHMIRFYIALGKSVDKKLAVDHEVLVGTATKPIAAEDPENITDAVKYYLNPEAKFSDTRRYIKRMRACINGANGMAHDNEIVEGEDGEGEIGGAAFWAKDALITIEVLDSVCEYVSNGKNTVGTFMSPDGKVTGIEHSLHNIRNAARGLLGRQTRSSSSLRVGLTVGTSTGSSAQQAPVSGRASRSTTGNTSAPASGRASRSTTLTMTGT